MKPLKRIQNPFSRQFRVRVVPTSQVPSFGITGGLSLALLKMTNEAHYLLQNAKGSGTLLWSILVWMDKKTTGFGIWYGKR